ncbi:HAD domain-containing protein [Noviherbaspirillum massiliense]|uniref:HAD domain-containing protein n=1 Tax=Noviherbaspirillum massiliense TaxID=1465823 RepID=UPI0002F369DA|nr:HAD domain-containing protein [Noviherbaspirillum massiliense]
MILFLDFDGVLHPFSRPDGPLTLVPRFERFMRQHPEVKIVVSSAWREVYELEELQSFFSADIAERIIDATPILDSALHEHVREKEILAWLEANGRRHEEWAAIDDTSWFFAPDCPNLVLVDGEQGFGAASEEALRMRFENEA